MYMLKFLFQDYVWPQDRESINNKSGASLRAASGQPQPNCAVTGKKNNSLRMMQSFTGITWIKVEYGGQVPTRWVVKEMPNIVL